MDHPAFIARILSITLPLLYAVVSVGYVATFLRKPSRMSPWVRVALLVTVLVHAALLGLTALHHERFPFASVSEAVLFWGLTVSLLCIALQWFQREYAFGAFVFPANVLITGVAALFLGRDSTLPAAFVSHWFVLHVSLSLCAYACFFVSFILSVMHLLQYYRIRRKRIGPLVHGLPSLALMEDTIMRADGLGALLLLLGTVVGFLWLEFLVGAAQYPHAKINLSIATIIVYGSGVLLRALRGWRGWGPSLLSIVGFIFVLLTLSVGPHGY